MGELCKLQNIGKIIEEQLNQVDINTFEQLKEIGSNQTWLKLKAIDNSSCLNKLYALEGAIQQINKKLLPIEKKAELKEFYDTFNK